MGRGRWRWRQKLKGSCLALLMSSRDEYTVHLVKHEHGNYRSPADASVCILIFLVFIHSCDVCWACAVPQSWTQFFV